MVPRRCTLEDAIVLKRVMRRALRSEPRATRDTPKRATPRVTQQPTTPQPPTQATKATQATQATGSIASRLAGGLTEDPSTRVKATSGASAEAVTDQAIHHAEDGTAYWGELDNESARAKADGKTLVIDQWECISCGTCVENTDAVFVLPDDGKAVPIRQEGDMSLIQDAIDACPVTCIHWSESPDEYEQLNDAKGDAID